MEEEKIAYVLEVVKDQLVNLADAAYRAQLDGKISWFEGLTLATQGTAAANIIFEAFKELSSADFEDFISTLRKSDLTLG